MSAPTIKPLTHNTFGGMIGVAREAINPPAGMFARTWGSAAFDIADGLHRPLHATCLAIAAAPEGRPAFFITLDLMAWMSKSDEEGIRLPLEDAFDLRPGELILQLSHSHGAPFTDPERSDAPGGGLIAPYREQIITACRRIMADARAQMRPSVLTWATGRCGLAYNRDLVVPETGEILCGLNPDGEADDTLLVGRVTDETGAITATLVNYGCHPTSTGGGNRLISPDYIGAMREIIERETGGAICVFLHGADAELTPRRSFEDDVEAADQNGRELGYSAMAALSSMFPPGHAMVFAGREESGTALGRWRFERAETGTVFQVRHDSVSIAVKTMPSTAELEEQVRQATGGFERERAQRRLAMRGKIGDGETFDLPIMVWRMGPSFLVGAPVEFYSTVQIALRARFPEMTIAVLNICNGFLSYLPPAEEYQRDVYPVRIAIFEAGGMERAVDKAAQMIEQMAG